MLADVIEHLVTDVDAEGPDGLKDSNYGLSAARGSVARPEIAVVGRLVCLLYTSDAADD